MGLFRPLLLAAVLPWLCLGHGVHDHHHHHHERDLAEALEHHERELSSVIETYGRDRCGTHMDFEDPEVKEMNMLVKEFHDQVHSGRRRLGEFYAEVPTYYHVILRNEDQYVPPEYIQRQNDVINEDFKDVGIHFVLKEVTSTINEEWYFAPAGSTVTDEMYRALHRGGLESLNVYIYGIEGGILGFATIPHFYIDDVRLDGISMYVATLPGIVEETGEYESEGWPYGGGATLTHEIGHWMNLFHTFGLGGGCAGQYGDFVEDTAYEAFPFYGCEDEGEVDTCTSRPGVDNINNFMNYAQDACMTYFSPGQIERMQTAWIAYRAADDCYNHKYSSGGYGSGGGFCERRCRLQVPTFYKTAMDCIQQECKGGDTCETPVTISTYKSYYTKSAKAKKNNYSYDSSVTVHGNTKTKFDDFLFPTNPAPLLFCGLNVIDSARKYFEIEGDGSIFGIQTSSALFYPKVAVATDGCELNCVSFDIEKVDREGVIGGVDTYFYGEKGVMYTIVVHGQYGGDFTMTVESGVEPDSDCFETSKIPTCMDETCSATVCLELPECCSDSWSYQCVVAACSVCSGATETCDIISKTFPITIDISTDFYPEETTWRIVDVGDVLPGQTLLSGGPYPVDLANSLITEEGELYIGCFEFFLFDSFGDGGAGATINFFGTYTVFVPELEASVVFGACNDPVPPESNCYEVTEVPGCTDAVCSELVCDINPGCCFAGWTPECVLLACDTCGENDGDTCEILSTQVMTRITLELDSWPIETTWEVIDAKVFPDTVVASGGPYSFSQSFETIIRELTLYPSCFDFGLFDSFGDGGPTATIEYGNFTGSVTVLSTESYLRFGDCDGVESRPTPAPTEPPEVSNCYEPSTVPECEDPDCVDIVCALDSFCCFVAWDGFCVDIACENCANATQYCPTVVPTFSPAPTPTPVLSDCFTPSTLPGCANETCAISVCDLDGFCCEVAFDEICVGLACDLCEDVPEDICANLGTAEPNATEAPTGTFAPVPVNSTNNTDATNSDGPVKPLPRRRHHHHQPT